MTDRQGRIFDELARFMTDAAGAAQGMKREVETMARHQVEKLMQDMDIVTREQFEIVEEMARKAREENETLRARLEALEKQIKNAEKPAPKPRTKTKP